MRKNKSIPNIIIFNPDQWRGDVVSYIGNKAAITPNLDAIVQNDAVGFANAFCQNPVCTPSRCSFMSGWYPHVRGHRTMFYMMRPDEPVLLKTLKDNGYFVWWGGKNDLVPAQHGFSAYCDIKFVPQPGKYSPAKWDPSKFGSIDGDIYYSFFYGKLENEARTEDIAWDWDWGNIFGAIDFINSYNGSKPFCIYLPLGFPHPPYRVENPWHDMINRALIPPRISSIKKEDLKPSILKGIIERQNLQNWSEERWRELRAVYYGMCARVDYQFGLVVEALRKCGLYDNTAIFFFADHGDFTGDYGLVEKTQNTFEDCLTRVPFVIKPPANVPLKPGVRNALVELIDFPATVEEITGIGHFHTHFGRSLLPIISGKTDIHRDAVFCEGGRRHGDTQCMELESPQGKEFQYWPRLSLQVQEGPEHTLATMCRTEKFKYVKRLYETDELYDLTADSNEQNNVINNPAYRNVLSTMRERLLQFLFETSDVTPRDTDKR